MSLEEQAKSRKEKLAALRARKQAHDHGHDDVQVSEAGRRQSDLFKFRNYDPETGTARRHDPTRDEQDTIEKQVDGLTVRVIKEAEDKRDQELDLFNIQPKRPNWDLKRDYDKKLAKLEPKTQGAIAQLIRQRLQGTQSGQATEDLAVNLSTDGPQADEPPSSDEED